MGRAQNDHCLITTAPGRVRAPTLAHCAEVGSAADGLMAAETGSAADGLMAAEMGSAADGLVATRRMVKLQIAVVIQNFLGGARARERARAQRRRRRAVSGVRACREGEWLAGEVGPGLTWCAWRVDAVRACRLSVRGWVLCPPCALARYKSLTRKKLSLEPELRCPRSMPLGKALVKLSTGLAFSAAPSVETPPRGLDREVLYRGGAGMPAHPWGLAILLE